MTGVTEGVDRRRSQAKSRAEIGAERRAKMRSRLLAAGARVIADRGHEHATIDDFIQEASVARGTFYNHFPTREDLLQALWATVGHDPFIEIQRACSDLADPAEHLSTFTRLVLRRGALDPTWGWLVLSLSAERASLNDDLRSYPLPDLEAGALAGRLRFDDLATGVDLIVSSVRGALRVMLTEPRGALYPETLCKMLLLAFGVPQADAHRISHMPLPDR